MPPPHDRCRSCGADIVWCVTAVGRRRIPIEPAPAEDGHWRRDGPGVVRSLSAAAARDERARGVPLYRAHFATCPEARRWRGVHRRDLRLTETAGNGHAEDH
jgi:hypothetical protein